MFVKIEDYDPDDLNELRLNILRYYSEMLANKIDNEIMCEYYGVTTN